MKSKSVLFAGALMGTLVLAAPAAAGDAEDILAIVDEFFDAMRAKDADRWRAIMDERGGSFSQRPAEGGGWELRFRSTVDDFAWLEGAVENYDERYWSPQVLIRGPIAVVWTPYAFYIDGVLSHCGIDAFDLVKTAGDWKLTNAMWTVEPDACAELGKPDFD